MTQIRIIAVPPGQAPEWVRKKWVGLILPISEAAPTGEQRGVLGGKPENLGGYRVVLEEAMKILREKNPEAAEWWKTNTSFPPGSKLVFKKDVCKLLPLEKKKL